MRLGSKFFLVLASVSFLAVTISGFHFHVDAADHGEKAPHQHVHSYFASLDLDEDHIDVSFFEPATGFSTGETVALNSTLIEFEPVPRTDTPVLANRHEPLPSRHWRWRPVLRGPLSYI